MSSFLSRSQANSNQQSLPHHHSSSLRQLAQLQPHQTFGSQQTQQEAIADVFSDFRNFRNEAKKKAETNGGNTRQTTTGESPSENRFSAFQSNAQVASALSTSNMFSSKSQRNQQVLAASPARSYLVNKGYSANNNNTHEAYQSNQSNRGVQQQQQPTSNLDSLRRDIREISFDKNPLGSARPRTSLQDGVNHRLDSPHAASKQRGSLQLDSRSSLLSLRSKEANNNNNATNNQYQNNNNKQQTQSLFGSNSTTAGNKLISYSPEKHSQKVFSPNRLLSRLNSSPHTRFSDLEFSSKPSNFASREVMITTPTQNSLSKPQSRSSSLLSNNLSTLLIADHKSRLQSNATPFSKNKLNLSSNQNNNNNNSSTSFLSVSSQANVQSGAIASPTVGYLVDRKAQDLSDYLSTLSPADFNSLPRQNIEHLIKLSSIIMSKVKGSAYYKGSLY